jgi:transcriptional regulator CtsR
MKLSDIIEAYIHEVISSNDTVELKRSELATRFNCVPSQINYVIQTRFIPELGFYVESRRGGGGYIKITKINLDKSEYVANILDKIGNNLSQSVVDVYLNDFIVYNILDEKIANLIRVAVSDKSLSKVDNVKKDTIRADIFKNLIVNLI